MLGVLLPAKASMLLARYDEFRFARFDLRGKVIAGTGIESEVLLVRVSRRRTFAMESCSFTHTHSNRFIRCFFLA